MIVSVGVLASLKLVGTFIVTAFKSIFDTNHERNKDIEQRRILGPTTNAKVEPDPNTQRRATSDSGVRYTSDISARSESDMRHNNRVDGNRDDEETILVERKPKIIVYDDSSDSDILR